MKNNYPEFIDPNLTVIESCSCKTCIHNFENSGIVINFNPICAHCNRCSFGKSDMYREEDKNNGKL